MLASEQSQNKITTGAESFSLVRDGSIAGGCSWPQSLGDSLAAPGAAVSGTATFASNGATAAVENLTVT
jgi:hypothetical protein